ncbi:MAG: DUF3291 domain-containing protein [Gloeobacteraceae cyanobacterium ES-bin-316]|nr:DUF3291 domain-containing protein [Ferruginibacter sp.]
MPVSLTIIRYKKRFIPVALMAMAIHRLPLALNKKIDFFKLMGSGKNGTFDKTPDWQQWAVLTIRSSEFETDPLVKHEADQQHFNKEVLGSFIAKWCSFFKCETYTLLLDPVESHGLWDGKKVFGNMPLKSEFNGRIAVLTRATIRLKKLRYFWQNVAPVAERMSSARGFLFSAGVGEIPWIKQATFSVWQSKEDMKTFAYGMKEHAEVIKKTRKQDWYSEEMFTRFKIVKTFGTIKGKKPLAEF